MQTAMRLLVYGLCLLLVQDLLCQPKPMMLEHPHHARIEKVHPLNSTQRETNLSLSDDGNTMLLMSTRGGQRWSRSYSTYKRKKVFDGDIWVSRRQAGKWTKPLCLGSHINTSSGEDEPNYVANDRLMLYESWRADWRATGGPYYVMELNEDFFRAQAQEKHPQHSLSRTITQFFIDSQFLATDGAAISPDWKLFFVVCGKDYDENMDIYYSVNENGAWSYPQKSALSTPHNERSIAFAKDGRTLYFASDGWGGLGGLDIHCATLTEEGEIESLYNVGAPFNGRQDDYGWIVNAAGTEAYFIRDEDVFFADISSADNRIKPDELLTATFDVEIEVKITGEVKRNSDHASIPQATVQLLDELTGELIAETYTDAAGNFVFQVPNRSANYVIKIFDYNLEPLMRVISVRALPFPQRYSANFQAE